MSWYERPYADDERRARRAFSENPLNWAPTIGYVAGIRVRLHMLFILFIAFELLSAGSAFELGFQAQWLFILFGCVFLHELGHCFAARRVGGRADDVLMWPLGGLATVDAPRAPWPTFVTVICGPLVNLAIWAAAWLTLRIVTPAGDPFGFSLVLRIGDFSGSWGNPVRWLRLLAQMNLYLFLFNLWPMYPMDGGRLLHCALWPRLGMQRAMMITTSVGMVAAIAMGLYGLVNGWLLLLAIAAMGYMQCMQERMWLRAAAIPDEGFGAGFGDAYGADFGGDRTAKRREGWWTRWRKKRLLARRQRELATMKNEQAEVDRILAKVHDHGLHSLTRGERRTLETATERQRKRESRVV